MFYILTATTMKDGTKPSNLETSTTIDNACMKLHQTQAYNYANDDVVKALVLIVDEEGSTHRRDYFEKEQTE